MLVLSHSHGDTDSSEQQDGLAVKCLIFVPTAMCDAVCMNVISPVANFWSYRSEPNFQLRSKLWHSFNGECSFMVSNEPLTMFTTNVLSPTANHTDCGAVLCQIDVCKLSQVL